MRSWGLKGWLFLAAGLVFAAGASSGFAISYFLGGENRRDEIEPASLPAVSLSPVSSVLWVKNSDIYAKLGLAPEQQAQADRILGTHLERLKRLRDEREQLGVQVEKDLLALLDPAQHEEMRGIIRGLKFLEAAEHVSQKVSFLKTELTLSPRQEEEVYPVLMDYEFARDGVFKSMRVGGKKSEDGKKSETFDRALLNQKLAEIRDARDQKLRPILSDDQFKRFKELEEKRQRGWGGGGRGMRPPGAKDKDGPEPPGDPAVPSLGPSPVPSPSSQQPPKGE